MSKSKRQWLQEKRTVQIRRPDTTRGRDIWDLSTLKHAHRRRGMR